MRILFVSLCYPWPLRTGGAIRNHHLVRYLAARHQVTLLTLQPPPECSPLEEQCEEVISLDWRAIVPEARTRRFHPFGTLSNRVGNLLTWPLSREAGIWTCPEMVRALQCELDAAAPEAIWVDRSYIAESVRLAGGCNLTVDVDDLLTSMLWGELRHSAWYKSKPLAYVELLKLYRYEKRLAERFERLVFCKEQDAAWFSRFRDRVFVVPNGTTPVAACEAAREVPGSISFIGSLDYAPNIDAVRWFARSVFPRVRRSNGGARFTIVGRHPEAEIMGLADGDSIEMAADVPSVLPYYERASVIVSPVRMGSGTKLKVLEALAHGKALVATPHSVAGLDLRPDVDFVMANDAHSFADACSALLADPARRKSLAQSGRERVLAHYDWNAVAAQAERALGIEPATCQVASDDWPNTPEAAFSPANCSEASHSTVELCR